MNNFGFLCIFCVKKIVEKKRCDYQITPLNMFICIN